MRLIGSVLLVWSLTACPVPGVELRKDAHGNPIVFNRFPIVWYFSCDFPEDYKDAVRSAFQYWADAVQLPLFKESTVCNVIDLSIYDDSYSTLYVEFNHEQKMSEAGDTPLLAETHHDSAYATGARIVFFQRAVDQNSNNYFETVMRHEIGHALGLGHHRSKDCLMYPEVFEKYESAPAIPCNDELHLIKDAYWSTFWHR